MTDREVDAAILAAVEEQWMKVAMVMARAHGTLSQQPSFDLIHQRVRALVESGTLDSVGDISDPRASEVRRRGT